MPAQTQPPTQQKQQHQQQQQPKSKPPPKRPDGAELKRVASYTWPVAHVGHLTDNQQQALDKFKVLCEEKGYYLPAKDKEPPTHDDETLLRYLRARKFVPQDAFGQFKDTEDWRLENQLDTLYETIDVDEYESTRRLYPQWTGRRDKRGIPFYVYEISHVDTKKVTAYNNNDDAKKAKQSVTAKTPRKMLRLFSLYENLCRFVFPLCSAIPDRPHTESPVSQSSNLIDLSNVGFTKLWTLRNHMADASRLATAYYPETLDRIFVVGAPSYFPTIWGWAQRWFDPVTVAKIVILNSKDMGEQISQYVDLENVPKKYGGTLDWEFGDMPALDPVIVKSMRWKEDFEQKGRRTLPIGPLKWQYDADGDLVATAIGTEKGTPREKTIAGLHVESGVARLALSPGRADKTSILAGMSGAALTKSPISREAESKQATSDPEHSVGKSADAAVPPESRAGTYTIPTREKPEEMRQGTSETRFEQQADTHAEGQLADGTPETKIDGQGNKQSIMEPNTVGQAPKEHPVPEPEEPQPTLVEKAQDLSHQAYEQAVNLPQAVLAAVGLSDKQPEPDVLAEKTAARSDPAIDQMEPHKVEEFLRHQTQSTHVEPARQ